MHIDQVCSRSAGHHQDAKPSFDCVVETTGPFDLLATACRVLVLADVENWVFSARDLGLHLDFEGLGRLLCQNLPRADLHGVLSVPAQMAQATQRQAAAVGWIAHSRPIIATRTGRHANADNTFAFQVATLLERTAADALILGTGDGALGLDVVRAVRSEFPHCRFVATLSVAGATSRLLDARSAPELDANFELGRDVLHPLS